MTKWVKRLLSLAAIGSAAAGLIYYVKKIYKGRDEDLEDDFEDDDFDLDSDLKPVGDREYVPLNPKPEETDSADDAEADTADDAKTADNGEEGKEDKDATDAS